MKILDSVGGTILRVPIFILALGVAFLRTATASGTFALDIVSTLNFVQSLLAHVGPVLSAVLFVTAGIFFAIGQLLPSQKRAGLHSAAIDIIIGAIIVAVLSVASTGLALASTNLLTNVTSNTI